MTWTRCMRWMWCASISPSAFPAARCGRFAEAKTSARGHCGRWPCAGGLRHPGYRGYRRRTVRLHRYAGCVSRASAQGPGRAVDAAGGASGASRRLRCCCAPCLHRQRARHQFLRRARVSCGRIERAIFMVRESMRGCSTSRCIQPTNDVDIRSICDTLRSSEFSSGDQDAT